NDVPCRAARRPHHHHHPAPQVSGCNDPLLAVVSAIIDPVEGSATEHFGSIGEIQPSLFQGAVALLRIEGNLHPAIYVPPEMTASQLPRDCVARSRGQTGT